MIHEFRLSPPGSGRGVSCDESGAFVGTVPLLRKFEANGRARWEPRDNNHLSKHLGTAFGIPIDIASKTGGLKAICNALNDGDVARAQIATVLLAIPDPPTLSKDVRSRGDMIKFIRDLYRSGMIKWDQGGFNSSSQSNPLDTNSQKTEGALAKAGFNPNEPRDEHGRWTANEGTSGGELAPAQWGGTIAEPLWGPLIEEIPAEPLVPRIDIVPPIGGSRELLAPPASNPFPRRKKCVKEWEDAARFCLDLLRRGKLGARGYRGVGGKNWSQCVRGQVSEECGGNSTAFESMLYS